MEVLCDDTDLLVYYLRKEVGEDDVFLIPLEESRAVISIKETVESIYQ